LGVAHPRPMFLLCSVGGLAYRAHRSAIMRRAAPTLDHTVMCARAAFTSLALLPCEPMDAVLPGETMELHLGEASECRMLERARDECDGCFALLLKHDARTSPAGDAAADDAGADAGADDAENVAAEWLPLLQVMEVRQPDEAGGIKGFVCVRARCVSRVVLTEVPRRRGRDAFETAAAAAYVDRYVLTTAGALARTAEAAPLHASCRRLEERLWPRSATPRASMCASMRARHASAAERRAASEEVSSRQVHDSLLRGGTQPPRPPSIFLPTYILSTYPRGVPPALLIACQPLRCRKSLPEAACVLARCVRTTYHELHTTYYVPRTTDHVPRTTYHGLLTTDYLPRTTDYGLRATGHGLRAMDYGLRAACYVLRATYHVLYLQVLRYRGLDQPPSETLEALLPNPNPSPNPNPNPNPNPKTATLTLSNP
jgi:hypothetical protein